MYVKVIDCREEERLFLAGELPEIFGVRPCDCNRNQGNCHCSDTDCDWEPLVVKCSCPEVPGGIFTDG